MGLNEELSISTIQMLIAVGRKHKFVDFDGYIRCKESEETGYSCPLRRIYLDKYPIPVEERKHVLNGMFAALGANGKLFMPLPMKQEELYTITELADDPGHPLRKDFEYVLGIRK